MRYRNYWGTEGGVTVSGGEPLLQMDFLLEFFALAKEKGIHTVLDTAGQPFTREEPFFGKLEELMKITDLLLFDIEGNESGTAPETDRQGKRQYPGVCPLSFRGIGKPV